MKLRISAHLCGWPKEVVANRRKVMEIVHDAGYEGVEGFEVKNAEELVELGALAAEYGLHLVNVHAADPLLKAKFNATLGNDAAEVPAVWKRDGKIDPSDAELDQIAVTMGAHIKTFTKYGIKPFHHIHVNTLLETVDDCARTLKHIPGLWLLYDTGHLLASNCNPMDVLKRWPGQIAHVHLKNYWKQNPAVKLDPHSPDFYSWKTSRFCDLAEGNTGLDVKAVLDGLVAIKFAGWVALEEDHPKRDIAAVVRDNRAFLRNLGY
ncbi:MAG: TIM barrel protein [Kiritimatiellaeota bacterium]|nr:TIM barrel protein [Kiritimatiellota bacterium]